ncbi:hypothetical protein DINM_001232 [Dirofilaria immitis]|nr:hypothetical protein [Dirofilaria immitis]
MISERKILIFIAINILAVAIVVDTLPYGYARPPSVKSIPISDSRIDIESSFRGGEYGQDMEIEKGFPDEVVTTRKPYVPPPIIEPRDRGYEGVGRNGGGRRISYSRRSYK